MKSYLKYIHEASFGVVASFAGNLIYHPNGKQVIAPALEEILVWDIKKATNFALFDEDMKRTVQVTSLQKHGEKVAAGYSDGSVRVWSVTETSGSCLVTFQGHNSAVTCIVFDEAGTRLATGSKDTDIIVWDLMSECGIVRFKGHKDQITGLEFLETQGLDHLVSTSKDTLMKIWDLKAECCVETVVAHRTEVWAMAKCPQDQVLLVTAGTDQQLKLWTVDPQILISQLKITSDSLNAPKEIESSLSCIGILEKESKERSVCLKFHPSSRHFAVSSADRSVELFKMLNSDEIKKKQARKRRRNKEAPLEWSIKDEISSVVTIRAQFKVVSFEFHPKSNTLCLSTSNNTIEQYSYDAESEEKYQLVSSIELQGHRSDVRAVCLCSDNELLCTGSSNSVKVWNIATRKCIKTIESGYVVSLCFVPGNKHVIVGTKTGEIELYDLSSSCLLESVKAHDGAVWSLQVRPDKCGIASGSADKSVKFWDFELKLDPEYSTVTKRLSLQQTRALKMTDDVLCIKYSPDGRLIAVSLLDSTVKVFYEDSLKFFLSLYGHKLPVLSMDISSDGSLIATGSADKSIKVWGLDFGDCHRSLLAHQDSVMSVQFVWGTHYLFSASKDHCCKYWDLDKFEQIMKLQGHHSQVWGIAVGKFGNFVCSVSHDRSIRIYSKTDEQLFIQEEKEREMEEMFEQQQLDDAEKYNQPIGSGAADEPVSQEQEPNRKTLETLTFGEKISEALSVYTEQVAALSEYENTKKTNPKALEPQKSPWILSCENPEISAKGYVLMQFEKIPVNHLQPALLTLPFSDIQPLLECMHEWITNSWNLSLCCRVLDCILTMHFQQIISSKSSCAVQLMTIQQCLHENLKKQQDMIGFNLAALSFLKREGEARSMVDFMDPNSTLNIEEPFKVEQKRKRIN